MAGAKADRRIQAQTYSSICLAGRRVKKRTIRLIRKRKAKIPLLLHATRMDNSDTLWDDFFEDESLRANCITLCTGALFCPTARRLPGDALNRQREAFMAHWIDDGRCSKMMAILSLCGGWRRSGTGKNVARYFHRSINTPENSISWQMPLQVSISPPTVKSALMCLAGYLSGDASPGSGKTGAGSGAYSRRENNC